MFNTCCFLIFRGGLISADCSAGYFCMSGSEDYTPSDTLPENLNAVDCTPDLVCAGPCPAGYYCPAGIDIPVGCANHTLRETPGGASQDDCLPCPAGYWCHFGDPVPDPCPVGHYCEEGIGPVDCPLLTYRDITGGANLSDCYPCPAGFHCNVTGIDDYTDFPCPVGHYCPEGADPEWCPAGSMRPTQGAADYTECWDCREGYYCPEDQANVMGIPCDERYECPNGTAEPAPCPPGRYCPPETGEGIICPAGYVCRNATGSEPELCLYPYYCPEGANITYLCPLGYQALPEEDYRTSLAQACRICDGGQFGNHSTREFCYPCPAGYYCPAGAAFPTPCDAGYYCPAESVAQTPCPKGRYGNIIKAESAGDCSRCPRNTYNDKTGQLACNPCGSSAAAGEGASTCTCIGLHRYFQESDGSCQCESRYVYYNEQDEEVDNGNSDQDCQPRQYPQCNSHEIRLAYNGRCVDPDRYSCDDECANDGGSGSLKDNGQ